MSNIHHINEQSKLKQQAIPLDEQRIEQASDWIAKLDRGLSKDEKSALQLWLAKAPEHTSVLLEVAQLWDKMDDLSRLSDLFPQTVIEKKKTASWITTIAASVVIALSIGFYQAGYNILPFGPDARSPIIAMQKSFQTGIGESNTINLPDSSKMVLNTNSFVQVKYTDEARIIDLQRGEIHIDVAHDSSRPLSVIAGGKVIQAVGTAFNVEVRNEMVELIVTDGKVLVAQKESKSKFDDIEAMVKKLPKSSMAISKGEKVDLDLTGLTQEKVTKVDALDIAASLSWRQGNLIFRGESLAEAMAEISRYTDIEFELSDDQQLRGVQVAGMFKTGDVAGLLDVLTRNFNIDYEKVGQDKIILKYSG
ncbi:MAG: FecR domain-containing protein [Litorilituus sp.]|jgi:transmembrane sensor|nr:FecR domain-containing protein [Litorilituus sp.]